jgi:hypothetical protein
MRVLLLAVGIVLALTNCESRQATTAVVTAPTRNPAAGATPQRGVIAKQLATLSDSVFSPASRDTLARLRYALGSHLEGFVIDQFVSGDLNQDTRADFLVVCHSKRESRPGVGSGIGRLALVLNQGWPQMKLAAISDAEIDCLGTGCTFRSVTIKRQGFSVASLEGDCEKTYTVRTYRYSPVQRNWLLYKVGERLYSMCSYNSGENEYHEQTRRDFGRVVFGQ